MGLDTVELVIEFEKLFGIEISDAVARSLATPRDVRDFVVSEYVKLGKPADPEMIFEKIRDATIDISGARRDQIHLDTRFVHDLGLD